MRLRDVKGKRIVRVAHVRWYNKHSRRMEVTVDYIVLDDGSILYPFAFETEECPSATIGYTKRSPFPPEMGEGRSISRSPFATIDSAEDGQ